MAYSYKRNIQDQFKVTGIMDENAKTITYETKDAGTVTVDIQSHLDQFASQEITLTVTTKNEQELYLPEELGEE